MKPRIRLDDPHIRAVWEASVACGREVASWPAWNGPPDQPRGDRTGRDVHDRGDRVLGMGLGCG
jgi:hypothetical protein